jgi:hypothetical protein
MPCAWRGKGKKYCTDSLGLGKERKERKEGRKENL